VQVQGLFSTPYPRETLTRQPSGFETIDVTDSFEPGAVPHPYLLEEQPREHRRPDSSSVGAWASQPLGKERMRVAQGPAHSGWLRAYQMVGVVPRTGDLVDLFS
jgi:hypothetical protein